MAKPLPILQVDFSGDAKFIGSENDAGAVLPLSKTVAAMPYDITTIDINICRSALANCQLIRNVFPVPSGTSIKERPASAIEFRLSKSLKYIFAQILVCFTFPNKLSNSLEARKLLLVFLSTDRAGCIFSRYAAAMSFALKASSPVMTVLRIFLGECLSHFFLVTED